jgi:hypothetical protein
MCDRPVRVPRGAKSLCPPHDHLSIAEVELRRVLNGKPGLIPPKDPRQLIDEALSERDALLAWVVRESFPEARDALPARSKEQATSIQVEIEVPAGDLSSLMAWAYANDGEWRWRYADQAEGRWSALVRRYGIAVAVTSAPNRCDACEQRIAAYLGSLKWQLYKPPAATHFDCPTAKWKRVTDKF